MGLKRVKLNKLTSYQWGHEPVPTGELTWRYEWQQLDIEHFGRLLGVFPRIRHRGRMAGAQHATVPVKGKVERGMKVYAMPASAAHGGLPRSIRDLVGRVELVKADNRATLSLIGGPFVDLVNRRLVAFEVFHGVGPAGGYVECRPRRAR